MKRLHFFFRVILKKIKGEPHLRLTLFEIILSSSWDQNFLR